MLFTPLVEVDFQYRAIQRAATATTPSPAQSLLYEPKLHGAAAMLDTLDTCFPMTLHGSLAMHGSLLLHGAPVPHEDFAPQERTGPMPCGGLAGGAVPISAWARGQRIAMPGVAAECGLRILALGAELKGSLCFLLDDRAAQLTSFGDLSDPLAYRHYVAAAREVFADVLFANNNEATKRRSDEAGSVGAAFALPVVVHDLHPLYASTHFAESLRVPRVAVQHHAAHVASVLAENGRTGPAIGIACDGTGYGDDGAVWGCELFYFPQPLASTGHQPSDCRQPSNPYQPSNGYQRIGHLAYFPLVGGDAAARHTWRPAAGLLSQALGRTWQRQAAAFFQWIPQREKSVFVQQMEANLNVAACSSLGRVFDAVSFLLGLCVMNQREADAAIALERAAAHCTGHTVQRLPYSVTVRRGRIEMSLLPALVEMVEQRGRGVSAEHLAADFHETVAQMLAGAAAIASQMYATSVVALSGGCFANRRLSARLPELLAARGLTAVQHQRVPCSDAGLALGQAAIVAWGMQAKNAE